VSDAPPEPERGAVRRVPGPDESGEVRWLKREPETLVWSEPDPELGVRVVVKVYRRRGLVADARMRLTRYRAEREFEALEHLSAAGVPCSPPVSWGHGRSRSLGFHEVLVTRELSSMRNFEGVLRELPPGGSPPDLDPLLRLTRAMHACGCFHGVLKISNVMIGPEVDGAPTFALIDLDMARVLQGDLAGTWLARLDLLELGSYLWRRFGEAPVRGWLGAYGLQGAELEAFVPQLAAYADFGRRRRKSLRRRAHLIARLTTWRRGRPGKAKLTDGA